MSAALSLRHWSRAALIVLPLTLGLVACENNPFGEKEKRLPGERTPVFPEGVPGVQYGAPPQQPTNSNIPIAPSIAAGEQQQPLQNQQGGQQAGAHQPAPAQQPTKSQGGDPNDAWSGTR